MTTQKPYYRASVHRYKGCFWSDFCNGVKLHSVDLGMMLDVSEQVALGPVAVHTIPDSLIIIYFEFDSAPQE